MSNMTPVIVAIGSVTAKDYEQLRLRVLRSGKKPRVVRVEEDLFPLEYGMLCISSIAERNGIAPDEIDDEDAQILIRKELLERYGVDACDVSYVVVSERVAEDFYDELDDDMGDLQEVFFASEFAVAKT